MDHLYVRSFRSSVSVFDEDVSETDKIPLIHVPGGSYSSAVYIAFRKYLFPPPILSKRLMIEPTIDVCIS